MRLEHVRRVVDRERRLRHDADARRVPHLELLDVRDVLDQHDAAAARLVELAHRALDLGVALVADQDDVEPFARVARNLHVHLGDERTGRVEHAQAAAPCLGLHGLRNAVRAEDHGRAVRDLVEFLDEHGAEPAQPVDHEPVVHDLVAHVDRRAEQLERPLDDVDRAVDAGAEAAGIGEQNRMGSV